MIGLPIELRDGRAVLVLDLDRLERIVASMRAVEDTKRGLVHANRGMIEMHMRQAGEYRGPVPGRAYHVAVDPASGVGNFVGGGEPLDEAE